MKHSRLLLTAISENALVSIHCDDSLVDPLIEVLTLLFGTMDDGEAVVMVEKVDAVDQHIRSVAKLRDNAQLN